MKLGKFCILLLLLSMGHIGPAAASDFSKLTEPAFGRSLMLGEARQKELNCAALAYLPYRKFEVIDLVEDAFDEQLPEEADPAADDAAKIVYEEILIQADAEKLTTAVQSRVASDVGDNDMATELLQIRMSGFTPDWDTSAENITNRAQLREKVKANCQPIFEAAIEDRLDLILSPASDVPIALPDVDTCLAYDLIAKTSPDYSEVNYLHEDPGRDLYTRIVGRKGPKRRAREKEIAAHAASLGDIDPKLASLRLISCMATFAPEFRR